jgi:hypothetical protein
MSSKKHKLKRKRPEIWHPLIRDTETEARLRGSNGLPPFDSIWINDIYMVYVRREDEPFMEDGPLFTWLSIKRHDKAPCNDWRHFQFIKTQLCGPEAEGAQLYPAESRLVDGANQYHIWVLEPGLRFPFGFNEGRRIGEIPLPNGRQRPWPDNFKPDDIDEQNARSTIERDAWIKGGNS